MSEPVRPEGSSQPRDPMKKLAALREDYSRKLPAKLQQVTDLWNKCCYFNWSTEALVVLHNLVHSLAGGGKTFGYPALSDAAKQLEAQLETIVQSPHVPDDQQKSHISQLVAALPVSLQAAQTVVTEPTIAEAAKPKVEVQRAQQLIWVVDDDTHMANYLASQLQMSGFAAQPCHHLTELFDGIKQQTPAAVVLDIMFPEGSLSGIDAVEKLRSITGERTPVVFVSSRSDMTARLRAFRAGGDAYFTKPADPAGLVQKLDELVTAQSKKSHRILVVDDDADLGNYFKQVLETEGMVVQVLTKPLNVIQEVMQFEPDLVLLDLTMPHVDGFELAGVLRQENKLVDLPIVFLTGVTDPAARSKADTLGVNGFLSKPVDDAQLIRVVKHQVSESRRVSSKIKQASQYDTASGLANRKYFLANLEQAIAGIDTSHSNPGMIYITLDHFDKIRNQVGIVGLASLFDAFADRIQQQLATQELAAQLAEGVFALLTRADEEEAILARAQELYKAVFEQPVTYADHSLSLTGSVGVLPLTTNPRDVHEALAKAEQAAGLASKAGGNQVCEYPSSSEAVATTSDTETQHKIAEALKNRSFRLVFQPIVGMGEDDEEFFEVQLRLLDENDKIILPEQFYPIAEAKGLLKDLDRWTIEEAISRLSDSPKARAGARFFIRVSPASLNVGTFLAWISNCLSSSRLRGDQRIVLEMPEKDVVTRIKDVAQFATNLQKVNCGFAIEEFGTTHASRSLLNDISLDFVKVGERFTQHLRKDASVLEELRTLSKTAWEKGIEVIAGAVDNPQTMAMLWELGVRHFQGYYVEQAHESLEFDFRKAAERYLRM